MTEPIIRAFHVPADERAKTGIYKETMTSLKKRANIKYIEIVQMQTMHDHGFVMVLDEDGLDRRLPLNRRAQFLSTYTLDHPIVGDALFFSLVREPMEGDFLSDISQKSLDDYLQNDEVKQGYDEWLASPPVMGYSKQFGAAPFRG